MRFPRIRAAALSLCLLTSLGACAGSKALPPVDPADPVEIKVTLPPAPAGIAACARKPFPDIPPRDLTVAETAGIIGSAKILDREKSRCALRANRWIDGVSRDFARPAPVPAPAG